MTKESRAGRPRASSRETLAEAASELFLENGYEATSVADITRRAGVSRSSFFNYFSSKSDVLWSGFDVHLAAVLRELEETASDAGLTVIADIVIGGLGGLAPDTLVLAYADAAAMGLEEDLPREAAFRQGELAAAVAGYAVRAGVPAMRAEVLGAAWAGAVMAALREWAQRGAGRASIRELLQEAAEIILPPTRAAASSVRQLRVVVRAEDFDETVRLYRDVLGMAEQAAFEGEGDARVVILAGGLATLEIANPAQVEMIDRVETEGGRSERIRLALEVADATVAATALAAEGATIEAQARITPWGSSNARLRTAGDLQVTLFQEDAAP